MKDEEYKAITEIIEQLHLIRLRLGKIQNCDKRFIESASSNINDAQSDLEIILEND